MLRFLGSPRTFCDGVSRRNFLQIGAFGAGLTLADMLRAQSALAAGAAKRQPSRSQKAAIMIYLPGGPSHLDMYDLKPDAPKEFRGEFNPIKTNVPGIEICEHFPRIAAMMDKFVPIRSVTGCSGDHDAFQCMTGRKKTPQQNGYWPAMGAWVSKLRSESAGPVPPFVSLRGMSRGTEPGYLGVAHRPFTPGGQGNANLKLANNVTAERL